MTEPVKVALLGEIPPGESLEVVAEEKIIALFNVEGEIFALDGNCPHAGGPLGNGELNGTVITCPWHGWQFDVTTGQHQTSQMICQKRFKVEIRGEEIWVNVATGE